MHVGLKVPLVGPRKLKSINCRVQMQVRRVNVGVYKHSCSSRLEFARQRSTCRMYSWISKGAEGFPTIQLSRYSVCSVSASTATRVTLGALK